MADLNDDAPNRTVALPNPQNAFLAQCLSAYPPDGNNRYTRVYDVQDGADLVRTTALHLMTGFKEEVLERNMFVNLISVEVKWYSEKSGARVQAALTANASAGADSSSIFASSSTMARRVTELTSGLETATLPMHVGMSSILAPQAIGAKYPYLSINAHGPVLVGIVLTYTRGSGAIAQSTEVIKAGAKS